MASHSLRILHISDLHDKGEKEKSKWRRRRVLGDAWIENLAFLKSEWRHFDLVCFTGDIAFSGKAHELGSATEFIEATISAVGIPPAHFFPIPGNHDVDRDVEKSAWDEFRNFCGPSNDASVSSWLAGARAPVGASESWPGAVAARLAAYDNWLETTLRRPDLLPRQSPHGRLGYRSTLELPGIPFRVHVLGLNSAWLAGDDNDARKLRVTEDQAMRLATDEKGDALDGFRLALIHHPLGELADGEHVRSLVADKLDLMLRGHLHSPELVTVIDPDRALNEFAAGCLYEHDRYPNGCTILDLSLDDHGRVLELEAHLRAWSPGGFWYDDDSRYKRSRSGRVRLLATLSDGRRIFSYSAEVARVAVTANGQFARLEDRLRARTHAQLVSDDTRLALPRESTVSDLVRAIETTLGNREVSIVTGDPATGKSAVALRAIDLLRERGHAVLALSLRDIPAEVSELDAFFGTAVGKALRDARAHATAILVIDGAEAVLEDRSTTMAEVVRVALSEQFSVVLVARDDARDALRLTLETLEEPPRAVNRFDVPALDTNEVALVVSTFSQLQGIGADSRAAWLLARPGWVQLLLRVPMTSVAAADALSEAHVFNAIWRGLVRRNEVTGADLATPDAREAVLLALARRLLENAPVPALDPHALSTLRRDGLLLPFEAMRAGDDFAHDLVRDFAVARLLVVSPSTLSAAGAPRWAVHATRLSLQAGLIVTRDLPAESSRQLMMSRDLAARFGERWRDVFFEAFVGLRGSVSLASAWRPLLENSAEGLLGLLRWLRVHHYRNLAADVAIAAPVVEMICEHHDELATLDDRCEADVEGDVDSLLDAWLLGLALRVKDDTTHPLRCRVRDLFLRPGPNERRVSVLSSISLLGPDLDQQAEAYLRARAVARPDELEACVEGLGVFSLAHHRRDLLFFLAEAYYIEDVGESDDWLDDGIRRHAPGYRPLAAWFHGPFVALLRTDFLRACGLINKLLNHAARVRVARGRRRGFLHKGERDRFQLILPSGPREFVGDSQVWHWYRATGVGPYPCISALMALEKVTDEILVAAPDVPLERIVSRAMDGAESLAMPGLVVGMLTRHVDRVSDEFDTWLANPIVWELENIRRVKEYTSFLGGSAESTDAQKARRMWTPLEVSHFLMANAMLNDRGEQMQRLAAAGATMLSRAIAGAKEDPGPVVRKWASALDPKCYRRVTEAGIPAIIYEPPEDVVAELSVRQAEAAPTMAAWRLLTKYRSDLADPIDAESDVDLELAFELAARPPTGGPSDQLEVPTLVAARCLLASYSGRFAMNARQVEKATDLLLTAARRDINPVFTYAVAPEGADRSAARALPRIYAEHRKQERAAEGAKPQRESLWSRLKAWATRPRQPQAPAKVDVILDAIRKLARSDSPEVRQVLAVAISEVWTVACGGTGDCFHRVLLAVSREAAALCVLGPFDPETHHRSLVALNDPLEQTLLLAPADELVFDRLVPGITAIGSCSTSRSCAATTAVTLRDALLNAHARSVVSADDEHYDPIYSHRGAVAIALLDAGPKAVLDYFKVLGAAADPVGALLEDLAMMAVHDSRHRATFSAVWPLLFEQLEPHATSLREDAYWGARALAALIPAFDKDNAELLRIEHLGPRLEKWAEAARGMPRCIDALSAALANSDTTFQLSYGIKTMRRMLDGYFMDVARNTRQLAEWLRSLIEVVDWKLSPNEDLLAIVDGLVAAGDGAFLTLRTDLDRRLGM